MSDTTALNTGKKNGINKRLVDFFLEHCGRTIHTLESLFHVNEIYMSHVNAKVEGEKKGPDAMEEGSLVRCFKNIRKPDLTTAISRETLKVPISEMAARSPLTN